MTQALIRIFVVLSATAACCYAAFRYRTLPIKRIAAEAAVLGVALLATETAIQYWAPQLPSPQLTRARAASKLGLDFDTRTLSEAVAELRSQGIDALPGIPRTWAQLPQVRPHLPDGFYPLSHASNATIVECNEGGRYLTYRTGDYGLNNPPGLLDSGELQIAVVGESFALGHCLPQHDSLVGILRRVYPRTGNFGMAGTCTLAQLGTFREYVEPLRPRVVLWTVNPSFLAVSEDLEDPLLRRYLDPNFSQGLLRRQEEVDRVVRALAMQVQKEKDAEALQAIRRAQEHTLLNVLRLTELRQRVLPMVKEQLGLRRAPRKVATEADIDLFVRSLKLAHSTTEAWSGQFVAVLVPTYNEVVAGEFSSALSHDRLARALRDAGVPVIDATALFEAQPDPAALYTMRINNHPTPEGYALLGQYVLEQLHAYFPQRLAAAN